MSVPEAKALSPAPWSTRTLIARSRLASSQIAGRPAGDGPAAGARDHQNLDRGVALGFIANRGEPLIHREGEGIARLRAIERDPADAAPHFVEEGLGGVLGGL